MESAKVYLVLLIFTYLIACKQEVETRPLKVTKACLELPDSAKSDELIAVYNCNEIPGEFVLRLRNLDVDQNMGDINMRHGKDTQYIRTSPEIQKGMEVILTPMIMPGNEEVMVEARDTIYYSNN